MSCINKIQISYIKSKEKLFDLILDIGFCIVYSNEFDNWIKELEIDGLIIRCDKIPHHKMMLNPSYTYVPNDENGKELALNHHLGTIIIL